VRETPPLDPLQLGFPAYTTVDLSLLEAEITALWPDGPEKLIIPDDIRTLNGTVYDTLEEAVLDKRWPNVKWAYVLGSTSGPNSNGAAFHSAITLKLLLSLQQLRSEISNHRYFLAY
jgi:hypothetical protein